MGLERELADAILEGRVRTREELERLKRELARSLGLPKVPSDSEVLAQLGGNAPAHMVRLLRTKPSRSLSGVVAVAIMSPPAPCPHGRCAYCPGGIEVGTPQSYTGKEPAARRGGRWAYDAALQTVDRLEQLAGAGHSIDKVELVVMGGTFPAVERVSREAFLSAAVGALNGTPSPSLRAAIDANEAGRHRCVALTMETRPDLCGREGVDELLDMGVTRVEVGVQTTEDRPLELVARGHGLRESVEATRNLKDAGLKVGHHLMLGLPGMSPEEDLQAMVRVIEDPDLRPDLLKLYPTLVIEGTPLHRQWLEGGYRPPDEDIAVDVLARLKARLPPWVRVSRVERDIPSDLIVAGVRASNLRQLVAERLESRGKRCRCIRCREVGRRGVDRIAEAEAVVDAIEPELREVVYEASEGLEAFISLELADEDAIVAYARVRRPGPSAWRQELDGAAILRELRVLGVALPLGHRPAAPVAPWEWQHRGLGGVLLERAEALAEEWGMEALAVTSGMGARGYFRQRGYGLVGPYMRRALAR